MVPDPSSLDRADRRPSDDRGHTRRHVLLAGAAAGTALLAGCTGGNDTGGQTADSVGDTTDAGGSSAATGGSERAAAFRLLISDQPAAIDDFDSLDVSFDSARVFRRPASTETATATGTVTGTRTATATPTETATETETTTEPEADDADGGQRGFSVIDLDGRTVDLTRLVGERASAVFEGDLPEGRYTKIELAVADVVGIVDGEQVAVKVPSEKLQLTKPFTLTPNEPLDFVFDITVVRKGQGGYNLLPVISESGVAGEDVAVTEVPAESGQPGEATTETGGTETEGATTGTEAGQASEGGGGEQGNGDGAGRGDGRGTGDDAAADDAGS